jgi:hypothetical protein
MTKYATKYRIKNIRKSIAENNLFQLNTSKTSKISSSSSSLSPSKRKTVTEVDNGLDYDIILEQAEFVSRALGNMSGLKTGILRLRVHATRSR